MNHAGHPLTQARRTGPVSSGQGDATPPTRGPGGLLGGLLEQLSTDPLLVPKYQRAGIVVHWQRSSGDCHPDITRLKSVSSAAIMLGVSGRAGLPRSTA